MTVTAFVHGERIPYVHEYATGIDIHGVNAYGGAPAVPKLLADAGATKPFILTEFGPVGSWEAPQTSWGAAIEATSTEKAVTYRRHYQEGIVAAPARALGAYAFLWGHKVEATPTWFGMWLKDGARLAAVDVMSAIWTGKEPAAKAPSLAPLSVDGPAEVEPGATITVSTKTSDAPDDALRIRWALTYDTLENLTGGDFRAEWPAIDDSILEGGLDGARIRMPETPGPYRLYATLYDKAGAAATANVPLLVKGEPRAPMPFPVYEETFNGMPWVPSGWMGNTDRMSLDGESTEAAYSGARSIKIRLEGPYGWGAIAWQHPANNWGDTDGGFDLTGATALEVWARGQYGGEKVNFGVGLLEDDKSFPDSAIVKKEGIAGIEQARVHGIGAIATQVPKEGEVVRSDDRGEVSDARGIIELGEGSTIEEVPRRKLRCGFSLSGASCFSRRLPSIPL